MGSPSQAGARGYEAMQHLKWSSAERAVARKAFDRALHRELEAVIVETKSRAAKIQHPSDVWDLERYLTKRRMQIDREFDYRYSVLLLVFGNLIRQEKLREPELRGLNEEKIRLVREYAEL